jgi:hypothetical protein
MTSSHTPSFLRRFREFDRRLLLFGAAGVVMLICFSLLNTWFWAHNQIIDTPTYQRYGLLIRAGLVPYRDFSVEYPPGALPAFVLPTFWGSYASAFTRFIAICGIGWLVVLTLMRAPTRALAFVAVSPLLIGSLVISRFDFWPTLFVIAAVGAFVCGRDELGWVGLGLAIGIKIFALVLVPLAAVWTWRRRGRTGLVRGAGLALVVLVLVFGPFVVLAPHGVWSSIWGQASRPLQIETLAGSVIRTFGHPVIITTHGSQNLAGDDAIGTVSALVEAAVLVAIWIGFARGPMESDRFVRYGAGAVCAFIVLGKVLSPQFLIWLVPLVPLVRGRRGTAAIALLAAALIATQAYFPARYFAYALFGHYGWVVILRNLILVALLITLTLPARARLRSG